MTAKEILEEIDGVAFWLGKEAVVQRAIIEVVAERDKEWEEKLEQRFKQKSAAMLLRGDIEIIAATIRKGVKP